jgi:CRP-like cAMP-binding protein
LNIQDIIKKDLKIFKILKNCPAYILEKWESKSYDKDVIITHQGEIDDYFYIIIKGCVNIYRLGENGKAYSQSIYNESDYFGDLEIFDRRPYVCSIKTLMKCEVIRLHRKYFLQWVKEDKEFLLYLVKTLCRSFYKLSEKAGDDTLFSLKYRICNYLIYCIRERDESENCIEIKLNKKHLSEHFVVTQRSVNRILKYLNEKNIIEVKNDSVIIKDIKLLEAEEEKSKYE